MGREEEGRLLARVQEMLLTSMLTSEYDCLSNMSKLILNTLFGQGTGPWNLEIQTISPQETQTLQIQGIETAQKTVQIPIPKELQKNGGSFEIVLRE